MADAKHARIGMPWGDPFDSPGYMSFAVDGETDALEWIVQVDETGPTITKLGFRYTLRTGTPPTYRISIQGVDASGNPDGTVKGGGTPASATFTPPADATWDGTWQWVTLANSYNSAPGEMLAFVIDWSSGTVDGSNNSSFTRGINNTSSLSPFAIQNAATVRSRQSNIPIFGYASADAVFGRPIETLTTVAISDGGSPDEAAILFTLPAGWGNTFQVKGAEFFCRFVTAAKTVRFTLYDTDGSTVLQSVDRDSDVIRSNSSNAIAEIQFDDALSTLNFGSTYRLSVKVVDATGSINLHYMDVDAAGDMAAHDWGTAFTYSSREDAGAWTDLATRRLLARLILQDITEPVGGGGGLLTHPGTSGGFNA